MPTPPQSSPQSRMPVAARAATASCAHTADAACPAHASRTRAHATTMMKVMLVTKMRRGKLEEAAGERRCKAHAATTTMTAARTVSGSGICSRGTIGGGLPAEKGQCQQQTQGERKRARQMRVGSMRRGRRDRGDEEANEGESGRLRGVVQRSSAIA